MSNKNELLKTDTDKEQFKKWIVALRSGKYNQIKGRLNDSRGFCCLGVACDILIPENEKYKYGNGYLKGGSPNIQKSSPEWLKEIAIDFGNKTGRSIYAINDKGIQIDKIQYNMDFNDIADLLEAVYIHKVLED